ncbi:MarR family winged helix-turn-helix transcriptional regulator [Leekyejoonella antrihumi]|uniref:MarR family transcriptional regulator n=1 Tax=Leekyejoonella antrihumi TaxID=1660198 RepID=A0A563E5K2_9MICO|nr:MarR family transcriptional regulator [Leekyejoonella antrihumi]TWP37705.1 MarR family transcriptional regulator [Leekyejoonella antrihumi]
MHDTVDQIREQWADVRPELDSTPMGVIGRMSRASSLLDKSIRENFAGFDLLPGEFDVLATLRRSGSPYKLTPGVIGELTMVTSGAITNRIDRMVDKGLVKRELDPDNRRIIVVVLTRRGRELINEVIDSHVAHEIKLMESLSDGEQKQLAELLRKLLVGLGDIPQGDEKEPAED